MTATPNTPAALVEAMLRDAVETDARIGDAVDDMPLFDARIHAAGNAFIAARAISALAKVDPMVAAEFAQAMANMLDGGDIGGYAYRAAQHAGHNPQAWLDELAAKAGASDGR